MTAHTGSHTQLRTRRDRLSVLGPSACTLLLLLGITLPPAQGKEGEANSSKATSEDLTQAKTKTTLFGSITHSERLTPSPAALRTGTVVDLQALKPLVAGNHWFKIPEWYAGTWQTTYHTTYFSESYSTGITSFERHANFALGFDSAGFQKDASGQIWEYQYGKYITLAKLKYGYVLSFVQYREPISISQDRIVEMFRSHRCLLTKSLRVIQSLQCESIQTYVPKGNGLIQVDASIKVFDQMGNPDELLKLLAYKRRLEPFTPCSNYDGKDMRKLFAEYLTSQGLGHLIPKGGRN